MSRRSVQIYESQSDVHHGGQAEEDEFYISLYESSVVSDESVPVMIICTPNNE